MVYVYDGVRWGKGEFLNVLSDEFDPIVGGGMDQPPAVVDSGNPHMHIILDANALIDEGYGDSSRAHELLSIAGPLGFQVHVPKVVLEELVGHYSRRLEKAISAMSGHIADLAWLVDRELDYPIDESYGHNESKLFRDRLLARFAAANVNNSNYPTNTHEEVVKRATSRRRPFDDKGSGYRDTLIWFNILELAGELDGRIYLVARDKDFRDNSGNLHDDLMDDLTTNKQSKDRIVLVSSIKELMEQHIHPNVQQTFEQDPLETLKAVGFDVVEAITPRILTAFFNADLDPREVGLSWECEFTNLSSVDEFSKLTAISVRRISGNDFSVNLLIDLIGNFEIFIPRNDWDAAAAANPRLHLMDADWSDNGVLAAIPLSSKCELDLYVDPLDTSESRVDVSRFVLSKQADMTAAQ